MRTLELCAGDGGGLLGDLILGHTCVAAVEREPHCQAVLRARQKQGFLPEFPIHDDVRTFDGRPWRGSVDVVAGGIPCQGFSGAGKGLGEFDPRNLWPDALRILREVRAPWFFLENVDRLTAFDYWGVILQDLAAAGYDARWCVLSAGDVGAPHLRKRIWLLATDTDGFRLRQQPGGSGSLGPAAAVTGQHGEDRQVAGEMADTVRRRLGPRARPGRDEAAATELPAEADDLGLALADTAGERCGEAWSDRPGFPQRIAGGGAVGHAHHARPPQREGEPGDARPEQPAAVGAGGRPVEPDLGRVADGLADQLDRPGWWAIERGLPRVAGKQPHRADRLRGCGNGQVALCRAVAWHLLGGPVAARGVA